MVKRQFETITSAFKRISLSTWLLLVLGTAVLVVLIGWLGSWGFRVVQDWTHLQQNPTDATQKQFNASLEIVKAIVGGLGTLATIVGGIVLYLNFKVANRNAELTESRLITERFSKAVEQLGSDKIEVRLGGIYALERIAQDSKRDHWTIMEVLTASVRETTPVELITKPKVKESFAEYYLQQGEAAERSELSPVSKYVQAALTVVGRRNVENDPQGKWLDLSYSNFSYYIDLEHANFAGADLKHASFAGANLKHANFAGADLKYANFAGADLKHANFAGAKLISAVLKDANLSGTNLIGAVGLTGNQLQPAKLCHTNMPDGMTSDRDCEAIGLSPSTSSTSETELNNH